MFTLFDLVQWAAMVVFTMWGFEAGSKYGLIWALLGLPIGLITGKYIGSLPFRVFGFFITREFREKSLMQIRNELRDPACLMPNMYLTELARRDAVELSDIDIILELLESDDINIRNKGCAALGSVFSSIRPQLAEILNCSSASDRSTKKVAIRAFIQHVLASSARTNNAPNVIRQ